MSNMNIMKHVDRDTCAITLDDYKDSKPQLRELFGYACCYCTTHEGENHLGFFHVDHFRPYKWFNHLEKVYENLYYACHKCNVYKRDNWISIHDGCIRNCVQCQNKICENKDALRFIDPCSDEPSEYFEENEETFEIKPKNNSKAGKYTIEMMRLNRNQLIRLRRARSSLLMWLESENIKLKYCLERLECAKDQEKRLEAILQTYEECKAREDTLLFARGFYETIKQKVLIFEKELEEIKYEIKKVSDVVYEKAAPYEW